MANVNMIILPTLTPISCAASVSSETARIALPVFVFCTRNVCTIGALDALQKLNRKDIYVVGYDVTTKTAEAMRQNRLNALIFQDPYQQGYKATQLLARHLLEGYLPKKPYLYIENRIVLKSNLDTYCGDIGSQITYG